MDNATAITIAIVTLFLVWVIYTKYTPENFKSCGGCSLRLPPQGTPILNPFVMPYSGTKCVDDLYIMNRDSDLKLDPAESKMYHLATPDHVELMGYNSY